MILTSIPLWENHKYCVGLLFCLSGLVFCCCCKSRKDLYPYFVLHPNIEDAFALFVIESLFLVINFCLSLIAMTATAPVARHNKLLTGLALCILPLIWIGFVMYLDEGQMSTNTSAGILISVALGLVIALLSVWLVTRKS